MASPTNNFYMINFSRFCLDNGLRILVHEDKSTPLVAINILYDVGSRDENPDATGLAHLFEHLMFGGTPDIPEYDKHLQLAGGENNAFTTSDITNYYITLPKENIETGLWLESDRMNGIDFSQKNLNIQKNVVIEEFNQRYLNQPYGDAMLLLRPLAFEIHPYRWPTIGMDIKHIKNSTLSKIKDFFFSHYAPNNAILSITGNITPSDAFRLAKKWFGNIDKRVINIRQIPCEPEQKKERVKTVQRDVPAAAIYKAWHIGPRNSDGFFTMDLVSDILAGGESGRLKTKLIREKKIFSEIDAYITSEIDPGLLIVNGKLMKGIDVHRADESINQVIEDLIGNCPSLREMEKVKNIYESAHVIRNSDILHKAMNLSYYELLGDPGLINSEVGRYLKTN